MARDDKKNAFNSHDRALMFEQLRVVPGLAPILPYVAAVYGEAGDVVLERGNELGPLYVKNEVGGRQGCVLAMLIFGLAQHPSLLEAAERNPDVVKLVFADDDNTLGPCASVPKAIAESAAFWALDTCGEMNTSKYDIYSPNVPVDDVRAALAANGFPENIRVSTEGAVVLGGPIGTDAFVAAHVRGEVESKAKQLSVVQAFESQQNQFFFLSQSLSRNFVHLMRLIPCHESSPAGEELAKWDLQIDALVETLTGAPLSDLSRDLISLSSGNGGLGVQKTAAIADACYVAGKSAAVRSVADLLPVLNPASAAIIDLTAAPTYATEFFVHEAIDRMDALAAGTREKLQSLGATVPAKLQHMLTSRLDSVRRHDIVALQTPATRALMRSNNPHTFANAHNRNPATTLSNPDFRSILRRSIRSTLVPPGWC